MKPSEVALKEPAEGAAPKRARGHLRVAAILQVASALFAERGYDAVTMTEIAALSGTAIGSLYRFFPTKELLADALLRRYGDRIDAELAALAREAGRLPLDALAGALVDHARAWGPDRAAALVLVEARNIVGERRGAIRDMIRRRVGEIVAAINPALPSAAVASKAPLLQHLLKFAVAHSGDSPAEAALIEEARRLVGLFLRGMRAGAD
jgi:AcrR family transcriptional regulator